MSKKVINTPTAPAPVGPYSQAIQAGNILYASGQIALDPATGTLIQDSIEAETHQVMKNIQAVLTAAGTTFENVLKCTIFLSDMGLYGAVNNVYALYFNADTAPARECVAVKELPKSVNVEISVTALVP